MAGRPGNSNYIVQLRVIVNTYYHITIAASPAVPGFLPEPMHIGRVKIRIAQLVRDDLFSLPCRQTSSVNT
jgi:hypothetical protein